MENENLDSLRRAVRGIDKDLAALFDKRIALSKSIAQVKLNASQPVYDAAREEKNIKELSALISSLSEREDFVRWYRMLMDISKKVQREWVAQSRKKKAKSE